MKNITKILTLLILLGTLLNAAPARGGLITFTQPDGTTFQGYLKGDAAFHWIESDSKVVMVNPQDEFYYNAKIDKSGKLVMTKEKPSNARVSKSARASAMSAQVTKQDHRLDSETKKALMNLQKQARKGHHPR